MKRHALNSIVAGLASCLVWASATAPAAAGPYLFHLNDLGILPGDTASYAYGINSSGQVVGQSLNSSMMMTITPHFISTSPNGLYTAPAANRGNGVGFGINDNGQVTGRDNNSNYHAVRLNPGQSIGNTGTNLGTLGGPNSIGTGINASGQVVGWAITATGQQHAYRTTATGLVSDPNTDLGTLGGVYSVAQGINAAGQTVGVSTLAAGHEHAFRTSANGLVSDPGADLGTMTGRPDSIAYGINASGETVGYGFDNTMMGGLPPHAFRTSATGDLTSPAADLGTLAGDTSSIAYAINNAGWVVGTSGAHAMLQDGTTMYDLATLLDGSGAGWTLQIMYGINSSDQIVGSAFSSADQQFHAIRLDPTAVPEPGSLVLVGLGGLTTIGYFGRRRGSFQASMRQVS